MAQLLRLVSARASHQAVSPDENSLLSLCVFSLTLRADLEDIRKARTGRASLTSRLALAPYSQADPLNLGRSWDARPEANSGGLPVRSTRESGGPAWSLVLPLSLRLFLKLSHYGRTPVLINKRNIDFRYYLT